MEPLRNRGNRGTEDRGRRVYLSHPGSSDSLMSSYLGFCPLTFKSGTRTFAVYGSPIRTPGQSPTM